jgi:hypothetical protein
LSKNPSSIFCNEDQMHMNIKSAMSSMSNIIVIFHSPSIIEA